MKKIGILTYHRADNPGAVLQAYALQTVLRRNFGLRAELIDYRCPAIEATKYSPRGAGLRSLPLGVYYALKRRGFAAFRKKRLLCSRRYTPASLSGCTGAYDAFLTGSDQVWNPECSGWDGAYFLDFVPQGILKYAYAASVGNHRFSPAEQERFSPLLKTFDGICLREPSGAAALGDLGITGAAVCPDPVCLLPAEHWETIMSRRLCKARYVLVYQVLPGSRLLEKAKEYAQRHSCRVISNKKSLEFILHNAPGEFLSWIQYADCVFTDSFHGTAFSLLLDKLLAVETEMAGGGQNLRVLDLLEAADARQCILNDSVTGPSPADARQALARMRAEGLAWLSRLARE